MLSFSIQNFGCRVNQAEAFDWTAEFQRRGLAFEPDADRSGLVVLNSCTLTARADRDVRKFIRHVARNNPQARIVVTGCLAERAPAEMAALPGVWKVIPNGGKESLPLTILSEFPSERWENLKNSVAEGSPISEHWEGGPRFGGNRRGSRERWEIPEHSFRRRAFLKVQDGCGMSCAFCVIPSVRGKSRSVPPGIVRARLAGLASRNFREAVLTGIHLSSYGRDLEPKRSLLDLLREIEDVPGGLRVRLSSLDPRLAPPELIDHIAASRTIRPHFHLSLQHASEKVLRAMGRPGSGESHLRILERFRERSPSADLGADILVGFPGEDEADFRFLEEFLEASPLTAVHVFAYSARPGTPAANLPRIDGRVRKERADRLRAFAKARDLRFRREQEGRTEEAVVIRRLGAGAEVLTANAIDIRVPSCDAPEGEAVMVRIGPASEGGTSGEVVAGMGVS
jgi:threonylcarbamoyladenosine tRNA methylthiotransferase MtaB